MFKAVKTAQLLQRTRTCRGACSSVDPLRRAVTWLPAVTWRRGADTWRCVVLESLWRPLGDVPRFRVPSMPTFSRPRYLLNVPIYNYLFAGKFSMELSRIESSFGFLIYATNGHYIDWYQSIFTDSLLGLALRYVPTQAKWSRSTFTKGSAVDICLVCQAINLMQAVNLKITKVDGRDRRSYCLFPRTC